MNDPKRARDRSSLREPGSFTQRFLSHHNRTAVRGGRKRPPIGGATHAATACAAGALARGDEAMPIARQLIRDRERRGWRGLRWCGGCGPYLDPLWQRTAWLMALCGPCRSWSATRLHCGGVAKSSASRSSRSPLNLASRWIRTAHGIPRRAARDAILARARALASPHDRRTPLSLDTLALILDARSPPAAAAAAWPTRTDASTTRPGHRSAPFPQIAAVSRTARTGCTCRAVSEVL